MPDILVVADDLTGALDSAVAFVGLGTVRIARHSRDVARALEDRPQVLAVSTGTREGGAENAEARIGALAEALDLPRIPLVMKKVDSRLKGHVGPETALLARLSKRDRVVAAPAIPAMGRLQQGGMVHGEGIAEAIDIGGRFAIPGLVVPDIAGACDLDAAAAGDDGTTLWAGARDLAFALARRLGAARPPMPVLNAPILFAIGSRDPVTLAQIGHLRGVQRILDAPDGAVPVAGADVGAIALTDGGGGLAAPMAGAAFADGIARACVDVRPSTLLLSGGETAQAILDRLGIRCLDLLGEIAPGLPVSTARTAWGDMRIVTKSGGFGAPDLLARIAMSTVAETEGQAR